MLSKVIILVFILIGGSVGFNYLPNLALISEDLPRLILSPWVGMAAGIFVGWLIGVLAVGPIRKLIKRMTDFFSEQSASYILFGSLGLVLGLIISWLINLSLVAFSLPILSDVVPVLVTITMAGAGFYFGSTRVEDIRKLFTSKQQRTADQVLEQKDGEPFRLYKVLDTSVIIDGRILDVIRTGFLEGIFIVSEHVLQELQHIADSSDSLKRARGRRGLDILNALQREEGIQVEMNSESMEEVDEVDMKLVHLAKKLHGSVVTNDYNLNKVAEFQNVPVLNVNELANVVKPVVIPGEKMQVLIVKNGTERQQGVAYLEDGTMVVVEDGKHYINETVNVIVTSSLQTNAGRMIFANLDEGNKALENNNGKNGSKGKKEDNKNGKNKKGS